LNAHHDTNYDPTHAEEDRCTDATLETLADPD